MPPYHLLTTVPGIGRVPAMTILFELDTVERFPTVKDFLSCARLVKGSVASAGKIKGLTGGKMGNEYLLAFSCKGRWFCPSCHQKKVQLFGALLTETILFPVPHRHFTLGIPRMLRPYFRFDCDLLKDFCRLAH